MSMCARAIFFRAPHSPCPFGRSVLSCRLERRRTDVFWSNDAYAATRIARSARKMCVATSAASLVCVRACLCELSVRDFLRGDECVRRDAHARADPVMCGRARACVCTRRCARERFTPDYYASRTSDRRYVGRRRVAAGKAAISPKIASRDARIYSAALTAASRAESIYFVGTVCAANTVG